MFEVFILFFAILLVSFLDSFYLSIAVLLFSVLLILPGVYAMLFGAPYLISSRKRIDSMLFLANLKKTDFVCELGCGDGRIIRKVADFGVKSAIGYEFSLPTYVFAYLRTFFSGSSAKIEFQNFWKQDYSNVDVLICFLLKNTMIDFEEKIWPYLRNGTRVVSNEFKMNGVEPTLEKGFVYLYVKK